MAILISDKLDFRAKKITKIERHYIMVKESVYE